MAVPYNRKQLIQRIRKHIANGYPNDSFNTSTNELMLYIDQAIAFGLVGQTWNNAKLTGVMEVPEAYLLTYQLTALQKDNATGYWFSKLPQPPVSLPLGYSINSVYSSDSSLGRSMDFFPIKAKRLGYRINMPMPSGVRYWVESYTIWFAASNNLPLLGIPVFVQMPTSRTGDITLDMNLPDDAIEAIFNSVTTQLTKRYAEPKDIVHDDLPAGNNNLKS